MRWEGRLFGMIQNVGIWSHISETIAPAVTSSTFRFVINKFNKVGESEEIGVGDRTALKNPFACRMTVNFPLST